MIVLGDVAYPYNRVEFDSALRCDNILLNCEGYLVDGERVPDPTLGVYNNINIFDGLACRGQLILGLANNHVMDSSSGALDSIKTAAARGHFTVGAGANLAESLRPVIVQERGCELAILAFGWDVIGCKSASSSKQGVAPLKNNLIIKAIAEQHEVGRKVVVFLHWGYELELYPQPLHRESARVYIDHGADIVIGCHSHCLQGYETYAGKHIFYGLGNAIFEEGYYFNGGLSFPEFCKLGLAINWDPASNIVYVGDISLDNRVVSLSNWISPGNHDALNRLSSFRNLNDREYVDFFRKSRRKSKLLPVFREPDCSVFYKFKIGFVKLRASIILLLFRLGIKGPSR